MNLSDHIQHPVFAAVSKAARQTGLRAYVIGGYVRDALLEIPSKDIDIVAEGQGIALAEAFAQEIGAKKEDVVIFKSYGTAMVRFDDEFEVEFVGARKESYQRESRKPIVEEGSLKDDQLRRDFTINALSISLNEDDWGTVHDPFGGLADLAKGVVRTPTDPDITFSDDPLRMLRAVRFAGRLGFEIDTDTWEGIQRNIERIKIVSQERITEELQKMVGHKQPSGSFKLLFDSGLLEIIFPELYNMAGIDTVDNRGHKDNFLHTLEVLDNVARVSENPWMRWLAIMHDIAKPLTKRYEPGTGWTFHGHEDKGSRMVPGMFRRLKLPLTEPLRYVQNLVALHQRPIALVSVEVSDSAIRRIVVDAGEDLDDLLMFCRCDITSKNPNKVKRFLNNYDILEKRIYEVLERDNLRNWQPPVDGKLIMETFNLKPSKTVGLIKNDIREAILEGTIPNDKEAALAYMKEIAGKYVD
ncbi:MAG: CCA tRNA nucleotidyltransferase [Bacteroidia bacterium]